MNTGGSIIDKILERLFGITRHQSITTLMSMGLNGHNFITDDSELDKTFCALVAWGGADAVCDYDVIQHDGTTISHSTVTIKDGGFPIYGTIKNLDVASGTICAYYALDYK